MRAVARVESREGYERRIEQRKMSTRLQRCDKRTPMRKWAVVPACASIKSARCDRKVGATYRNAGAIALRGTCTAAIIIGCQISPLGWSTRGISIARHRSRGKSPHGPARRLGIAPWLRTGRRRGGGGSSVLASTLVSLAARICMNCHSTRGFMHIRTIRDI